MKPGGICSRADLARALVRGDAALAAALAELLGFEVAPPPASMVEPVIPTQQDLAITMTGREVDQPEIKAGPPLDIPFWRLESYEAAPDQPADERPPVSAEPIGWRHRPPTAPATRLLAPWRELLPRLRAVLAALREGPEIDLDLTIRCLSRGQWLERFPHARRRRWGPRLQLIIDRSERLVPYWTDQDYVCGELQRLFPAQDLEQAVFHEGLTEPRRLDDPAGAGGYRPPAGGVVLALSDLGCLTPQAARADNPWLELGRRLAAAGARPVALLPCSPARCPAALRRDWRLVPWERPRHGAVARNADLSQRAERLLRLMSPAVRIEPGLLRAVRLSLGGPEDDAGVEAAVWRHPAIASTHSEAATLDPKRAEGLRAAFAAEPLDRQRRALALLRSWRGHLPEEIWFEEILRPFPKKILPIKQAKSEYPIWVEADYAPIGLQPPALPSWRVKPPFDRPSDSG